MVLSPSVHISSCSHFFLLLREQPALACSRTRTLSLSLWELLHAPEGISHRMPAFLLLVDNIFFKLALGSFEGNPDIVRKRVRGQMGKKKKQKKERSAFFSACYKFAIQAKKNKHSDSATDTEVPWLDVVLKLGLPPDPLLFTSRELFLTGKIYGIVSFPSILPVFIILFLCGWREVDGQQVNRCSAQEASSCPGSHIGSSFKRNVCFWSCTFNWMKCLRVPVRERRAQEAQLLSVSKWAALRSCQDLPPGLFPPHEDHSLLDWCLEKGKGQKGRLSMRRSWE